MQACRFPIPRITLAHTSHRNPKLGRNLRTGASKRRTGSASTKRGIVERPAREISIHFVLCLFILVHIADPGLDGDECGTGNNHLDPFRIGGLRSVWKLHTDLGLPQGRCLPSPSLHQRLRHLEPPRHAVQRRGRGQTTRSTRFDRETFQLWIRIPTLLFILRHQRRRKHRLRTHIFRLKLPQPRRANRSLANFNVARSSTCKLPSSTYPTFPLHKYASTRFPSTSEDNRGQALGTMGAFNPVADMPADSLIKANALMSSSRRTSAYQHSKACFQRMVILISTTTNSNPKSAQKNSTQKLELDYCNSRARAHRRSAQHSCIPGWVGSAGSDQGHHETIRPHQWLRHGCGFDRDMDWGF